MQISNCQWRPVAFVGFTSEWKRRIGGATPGFASLLAFLPLLDLPLPQVDPPADRLSSDPQDHAGSHHTAGAHVSCAELSGRLLRTGHSGRENRCRWPTDTFGTVLAFERQPMCKTHTHIYIHIYIYIYMHGSPEVSSSKVLDPVDTEEEWRKCDSSGGFPSAGYLVPKELRSRRDSITTLAIVG